MCWGDSDGSSGSPVPFSSAVRVEFYVYARVGYLFEYAGLPGYDQIAAQLLLERVLGFLRG